MFPGCKLDATHFPAPESVQCIRCHSWAVKSQTLPHLLPPATAAGSVSSTPTCLGCHFLNGVGSAFDAAARRRANLKQRRRFEKSLLC